MSGVRPLTELRKMFLQHFFSNVNKYLCVDVFMYCVFLLPLCIALHILRRIWGQGPKMTAGDGLPSRRRRVWLCKNNK